jgi:hypothetical protein
MTRTVPPKLAGLLARLNERGPVRRAAGGEYRTRCPAHDDHDPSLYVKLAPSGELILLRCGAGCDVDTIVGAIGLEMEDLFLEGDEPVAVDNDFRPLDGGGTGVATDAGTDRPAAVNGKAAGPPPDPAGPNPRHEVYTLLLDGLTLSEQHRNDLRRRGLEDDTIDRLGYKSLTRYALNQAVGRLKKRFDEEALLQVPGFGHRKGQVRFFDREGLIVPVRDRDGRIVALKVRCDAAGDGPKYVYASGGDGGASSGVPPHTPLGTPREAAVVRLTEGELKADVSFALSGVAAVGAPGVGNWKPCLVALKAMGATFVHLAFDADARTKPDVAEQLRACAGAMLREGFDVRVETWDLADGKGIDDLLAGGKQPVVLTAREALEAIGPPIPVPSTVPHGDPPSAETGGAVAAFPVDCLPGPVARFVTEHARAMQCPVDFLGVAVLTVAAAAIGGSRRLRIRPGYEEGPRLYTAIVAPPGSAKSPALRAACGPVYARQERLRKLFDEEMEQYEEDLNAYDAAKRNGDDPGKKPEKPVMRHAFVQDVTTESLGLILAANPRGVLQIRDELTGWVRAMDQYRGGRGADRPCYQSAWSGEPMKVDRKGGGGETLLVTHPYLSVLGCIPPGKLADLDAGNDGEDGFIHRLLFSFPDPVPERRWSWDGVDAATREGWHDTVANLYALPMGQDESGYETALVINLAPDARPLWEQWYNQHAREAESPRFPQALVGPWSKLIAYAARLALVVHLLRQAADEEVGEDVDAESLRRAFRLVDYFKSHARRVYARLRQSDTSRRVDRAFDWIVAHGGEAHTSDLTRNNVAGVEDKKEAEALMKELEHRGYGRCEKRTAANNREVHWFVARPDGAGANRVKSGAVPDLWHRCKSL